MTYYLLFVFRFYEASGGADDFGGCFNTIEEAKAHFDDTHDGAGLDVAQVATFDGKNMKVIWEFEQFNDAGKRPISEWRQRSH